MGTRARLASRPSWGATTGPSLPLKRLGATFRRSIVNYFKQVQPFSYLIGDTPLHELQ
jgi:hypothetical protein